MIGWGAHLYGFVFLSRKWATDKVPFLRALARVSDEADRADRLVSLAWSRQRASPVWESLQQGCFRLKELSVLSCPLPSSFPITRLDR